MLSPLHGKKRFWSFLKLSVLPLIRAKFHVRVWGSMAYSITLCLILICVCCRPCGAKKRKFDQILKFGFLYAPLWRISAKFGSQSRRKISSGAVWARGETHTWCDLSANLRFRSETCYTRLAENTGRKNSPENLHLSTIAQICRAISSQLSHVSIVEKNC